jgi:hypothetical protein
MVMCCELNSCGQRIQGVHMGRCGSDKAMLDKVMCENLGDHEPFEVE